MRNHAITCLCNISMNINSLLNPTKEDSSKFLTRVTSNVPLLNNLNLPLLPLNVDEFACLQLDRLNQYLTTSPTPTDPTLSTLTEPTLRVVTDPTLSAPTEPTLRVVTDPTSSLHVQSTPTTPIEPTRNPSEPNSHLIPSSSWLSISNDVLKQIKYVLSWIQYAINKIDQQLFILVSHVRHNDHDFMQVVTTVKRDLVDTVRRVVEVIGRYAVIVLPRDASSLVKRYILNLPSKMSETSPLLPIAQSPTPPVSPTVHFHKVHAFGSESNDMLKSVHHVFKHASDVAEGLIGRVE